jgi:hypothetical protein
MNNDLEGLLDEIFAESRFIYKVSAVVFSIFSVYGERAIHRF